MPFIAHEWGHPPGAAVWLPKDVPAPAGERVRGCGGTGRGRRRPPGQLSSPSVRRSSWAVAAFAGPRGQGDRGWDPR